tara:strand:+ start:4721 stop:4843 length:123 start_codon:yes stop_codon:yes gene_type:complete
LFYHGGHVVAPLLNRLVEVLTGTTAPPLLGTTGFNIGGAT